MSASSNNTSGAGEASGPIPLRSSLKTDDDGDKTPPASGSLKVVTHGSCFDGLSWSGRHGLEADEGNFVWRSSAAPADPKSKERV
ncbi:hypothetical protein ACRE_003000 [Hapsidospora chrysogenum ATCC 11550]|uniref:Uncharacterized protein n=1 Tax=Hapsidospora chrysogenum (strain ATCC 11550 / CBS 779.69 / DSM 880 / IAM 14645 / JCM 23072 / IMI 49137) TaxID=857340 RepID=A0A086TH76_HAPC1|nr:hypothetical protein ACRE_003000 [Hapsidospora chrysogenum ATCC 11550]